MDPTTLGRQAVSKHSERVASPVKPPTRVGSTNEGPFSPIRGDPTEKRRRRTASTSTERAEKGCSRGGRICLSSERSRHVRLHGSGTRNNGSAKFSDTTIVSLTMARTIPFQYSDTSSGLVTGLRDSTSSSRMSSSGSEGASRASMMLGDRSLPDFGRIGWPAAPASPVVSTSAAAAAEEAGADLGSTVAATADEAGGDGGAVEAAAALVGSTVAATADDAGADGGAVEATAALVAEGGARSGTSVRRASFLKSAFANSSRVSVRNRSRMVIWRRSRSGSQPA